MSASGATLRISYRVSPGTAPVCHGEPVRGSRPRAVRLLPPGGRTGGRQRLAAARRELIPSLVKILRRCHSTVRGLRNSWVLISGLENPSRASRAIWASWGVSSVIVSTVRLRTVSPVATVVPGALGESLDAHGAQHFIGQLELFACIEPAVLAP